MTGAVVNVTTSEMQSAPSGSPLAPRTAKKPMRPTTSRQRESAQHEGLGGAAGAAGTVRSPSGAVSGAVESSRLMKVLPQRCRSGSGRD